MKSVHISRVITLEGVEENMKKFQFFKQIAPLLVISSNLFNINTYYLFRSHKNNARDDPRSTSCAVGMNLK
jgi:hypothetical protein